jgi:MFS family permease
MDEHTSLLERAQEQRTDEETVEKTAYHRFLASLKLLKQGPRDFWLILVILLLHGFLYFSLIIILPIFLSDEFGYSDTKAGLVYGGMGAGLTMFGIIFGTTVDRIGVRFSEILSSIILLVGGVLLAFAFEQVLMYFCILVFLPIGGALGIPVTKIATRRYTTEQSRSSAFSLVFIVMNISAMLGYI